MESVLITEKRIYGGCAPIATVKHQHTDEKQYYETQPTDHIVQPPTKPGASTQASEELWLGLKICERAFGRGCGACHDMETNPDLIKLVPTLSVDEFTAILNDGKLTKIK